MHKVHNNLDDDELPCLPGIQLTTPHAGDTKTMLAIEHVVAEPLVVAVGVVSEMTAALS